MVHAKKNHNPSTSWGNVGKWYSNLVGQEGHYYHQHIILPRLLELLRLGKDSSVLDIGCGQGVFSRQIPPSVPYAGLDVAKSLIAFAKTHNRNPHHEFFVADVTKSLPLLKKEYSHAVAILSLQNMENQEAAIFHVGQHVRSGGIFAIVLNHPCFRIPRQSGWGISESKQQYRYINRYKTPMKIPIVMHPGDNKNGVTWSFHYPLEAYAHFLQKAGFVMQTLEEWSSDKESTGKVAKMENRARAEIPLFLTIIAKKT